MMVRLIDADALYIGAMNGGMRMRLVDKDVLEDAVQGAINVMESQGISMITASVPLAIIKGAPTIDAIPMDWMRAQIRGYASRLQSTELKALLIVKGLWEREREAR
jgi:hypothetical protein